MGLIIGVTTSRRRGLRSLLWNRLSLKRAGAGARRIQPGDPVTIEGLSGLIIGGGDDISAELYGGKPVLGIRIDPARDALELEVLKQALSARLPILGICRGAQILNVHLGGTLHGDIYEVYENASKLRTFLPLKRVTLVEGSRLQDILSRSTCRVNALHHQSIDVLGKSLRVVGRDAAGIVQAVETSRKDFMIGVQWHPEMLIFSPAQQRLYRALAAAARDWADRKKDGPPTATTFLNGEEARNK